MFASSTFGTPDIHGEGVTGMHGIGVSTPEAAAVADATAGFAMLLHIPNGMIFTIGMWSIIFAAGWFSVRTRFVGSTTNVLGDRPNEHIIVAPLQT
jgi:hypothetical protein